MNLIIKDKVFLALLSAIVGIIIGVAGYYVSTPLVISENKLNIPHEALFLFSSLIMLCCLIFSGYKIYSHIKENKPKLLVNDSESVLNFIDSLKIQNCDEIIILAHTGRNTLRTLQLKLARLKGLRNVHFKIILKDPRSENTSRFEQITSTVKDFKNQVTNIQSNTVDVCYYSGLPYFNAVIRKRGDDYESCISFYQWNHYKTEASQKGYLIVDKDAPLFIAAYSWVNHLFITRKYHTIVFDMDDTIINSYQLQIKAWEFIIEKVLTQNNELSQYQKFLNKEITLENYIEKIKNIFLSTYKTEQRWQYFFNELPHKAMEILEVQRLKKRNELTSFQSELFLGCKNALEKLSQQYNLVIVSSASEDVVKSNINRHNLGEYFSFYLGRENQNIEIFDVKDKTPDLIKVSNLMSIAFNQMIFIGDSQTDYDAAKQLGITFIAANIVAKMNGETTYIAGVTQLTFNNYSQLEEIIEQI